MFRVRGPACCVAAAHCCQSVPAVFDVVMQDVLKRTCGHYLCYCIVGESSGVVFGGVFGAVLLVFQQLLMTNGLQDVRHLA